MDEENSNIHVATVAALVLTVGFMLGVFGDASLGMSHKVQWIAALIAAVNYWPDNTVEGKFFFFLIWFLLCLLNPFYSLALCYFPLRIVSGAWLLFNKCLMLQVQDVHRYASFSEMLEAESLAKVLPGVKTIDEGVEVYRKFYAEEKERANGVLAICVANSTAQPYIPLARILSGLSYRGVQCVLSLQQLPGRLEQCQMISR
ncbi:uncharacterized protein LOC110008869 [Jatropha curcas]|uniref:uncharacterized protein LOC110008869 n=1 Tax=Jatropha curcas TaxID=180498 RepID=UPI001893CE2C|nr:uncharacterized protein LOC110008869 [Jatropha curcas]